MRYDFIEIGTCDFETLAQSCEDWQIGLSIEAIKYYLDRLPERSNVRKVQAIISNSPGRELLYTVPEEIIKKYDLPEWVRGCSRISSPHPFVLDELRKKNIEHLYEIEEVETITIVDILEKYLVSEIGLLKTDLEGKDIDVINSLLDYGKVLPNRILFESIPEENHEKRSLLLKRLEELDYLKIEEGAGNFLYEKKIPISVVAMYDDKYSTIAECTIKKNFKKYCSIHGYNLVTVKIQDGGRAQQWKKIQVIIDLLKTGKSEWLFFIDADCLFMNFSRRIEDFINNDYFLILPKGGGAPDFELSEDKSNNNIMSSQLLIKNCDDSKAFFEEIWNAPDWPQGMSLDEFDHEMRQMRISAEKPNWKFKIKRLEEKLLNRFWSVSSPHMSISHPHMNRNIWSPGDFIVHVTGYDLQERSHLLKEIETFSGGMVSMAGREGSKYFFRPLQDFDYLEIRAYRKNGDYLMNFKLGEVSFHLVYWVVFEQLPHDQIYFKILDRNSKEVALLKFDS